ncbi:MAG TPA: hypothetical protein VHM90_13315 [Phycisphaerae bacterium]|nr:hypothetical protein [Phycisphaerae bacterium]
MPEELERAARKAGLLSGKFVRGAIEKELERRLAADQLLQGVGRIQKAGLPELTPEEIEAEIHASRAERRGKRANRR